MARGSPIVAITTGIVAVALFAACAGIGCALAHSLATLLMRRVVQGSPA